MHCWPAGSPLRNVRYPSLLRSWGSTAWMTRSVPPSCTSQVSCPLHPVVGCCGGQGQATPPCLRAQVPAVGRRFVKLPLLPFKVQMLPAQPPLPPPCSGATAGNFNLSKPFGIFRHAEGANLSMAVRSPSGIVYYREDVTTTNGTSSSSGGLSAGAIAGKPCCCIAAGREAGWRCSCCLVLECLEHQFASQRSLHVILPSFLLVSLQGLRWALLLWPWRLRLVGGWCCGAGACGAAMPLQ